LRAGFRARLLIDKLRHDLKFKQGSRAAHDQT
jgi:hypothetical protein